jgi:hypothetical protein
MIAMAEVKGVLSYGRASPAAAAAGKSSVVWGSKDGSPVVTEGGKP